MMASSMRRSTGPMAADLTAAELKAIENMQHAFAYLASERSRAERFGDHRGLAAYATAMKLLDAGVCAFEAADPKHHDADRKAMRRIGEIAYQRDIFGARPVVKAEGEETE